MKTNKVLGRGRLNQSDSFVRSNINMLICAKCDTVLVPSLNPQGCSTCDNCFCCFECCDSETEMACTSCQEYQPISPLNKAHIEILNSISFYCINKSLGCTMKLTMEQMWKHETKECIYTKNNSSSRKCPNCQKNLKGYNEKKNHNCNQFEEGQCTNHKNKSKITVDRIANYNEVMALLDNVKCTICLSLLRNPKQCVVCKNCFCEDCIVSALLTQNYCPSCYQKEPVYTGVQRNIYNVLNQFKIGCRFNSEGCSKQLYYKDLQMHEESCASQCLLCKYKCPQCNDYIYHDEPHKCVIQNTLTGESQTRFGIFKSLLGKKDNKSKQFVDLSTAQLHHNVEIYKEIEDPRETQIQIQQMMNDRPMLQIENAGYFHKITENIRQFYPQISFVQLSIILATALIDPIIQNGVIFMMFYYKKSQIFVNSQLESALGFFVVIYLIQLLISSFITGISLNARTNKTRMKFIQMMVCMFNLQNFLFVYVPRVQNYYFYNDYFTTVKNGAILRNLPQTVLMVTLATIIGINCQDTTIHTVTLSLMIAMIPFNVIQNFCFFQG